LVVSILTILSLLGERLRGLRGREKKKRKEGGLAHPTPFLSFFFAKRELKKKEKQKKKGERKDGGGTRLLSYQKKRV